MAATNFNVYFYNFTKKVNSTRTPVNGTVGLLYEVHTCYLRSPSSIIAPVLELSFNRDQIGGDGRHYDENIGEMVLEYNYAHIPRFNRYYFINNITWDNGMFILNLVCDVLGTYKEQIGNYNALIMRCSDAGNSMLYDENMYVDKNTLTSYSTVGDTITDGSYIYVLGTTIGARDSTGGSLSLAGLTYIVGSGNEISRFINNIMDTSHWTNPDGTPIDAETLANLNPQATLQSIVSVPVKASELTTASTAFFSFNGYYFYTNDRAFTILTDPIVRPSKDISIVKPVLTTDVTYLNFPPFSEYTLYLPFVGGVSISPYDIIDSSTINIKYTIDVINASISYSIHGSGSTAPLLGCYTVACGGGGGIGGTLSTGALANASIATAALGMLGGLTTAGIGAASVLAAPATGGISLGIGVGMIASGTISAASSAVTGIHAAAGESANKTISLSSGGSRAPALGVPTLVFTSRQLTGGSASTCGKPYVKEDLIKNHKGYMLIKNPSVDISGTSDEMTAINHYLNTGFYYEEE